ncbi:hypothetical protein F4803DRAFT_10050 [Xylaria telfairii]|nr:hypothetical protein F4803DRAFT_10050 [Xylaria telfairii]
MHVCHAVQTNNCLSSRGTSRMQVQSPGSNNGIRPWEHLETGHYRGLGIQATTYTYKCYTKPGTSLCISRSPRFPSLVMILLDNKGLHGPGICCYLDPFPGIDLVVFVNQRSLPPVSHAFTIANATNTTSYSGTLFWLRERGRERERERTMSKYNSCSSSYVNPRPWSRGLITIFPRIFIPVVRLMAHPSTTYSTCTTTPCLFSVQILDTISLT